MMHREYPTGSLRRQYAPPPHDNVADGLGRGWNNLVRMD